MNDNNNFKRKSRNNDDENNKQNQEVNNVEFADENEFFDRDDLDRLNEQNNDNRRDNRK